MIYSDHISKLQESHHRVFFQNAEGNINMGVIFKDPDVAIEDISWYNILAQEMSTAFNTKKGFISFDKKWKTYSCYVELHRMVSVMIYEIFLPSDFLKPDKPSSWKQWSK